MEPRNVHGCSSSLLPLLCLSCTDPLRLVRALRFRTFVSCRFDIDAMMRGELLDEFITALAEASVEEKLATMEGRAVDKKAVSSADD